MSSASECVNLTRGRLVAGRVDRAFSLAGRMKGLLGRQALPPGQGLWLKPCRQVHTWFMRYPIDVVFLDAELKVVAVQRRMRPWRVSPLFMRARSALELAAGRAEGVEAGDRLKIGPGGGPDSGGIAR